MGKRLLDLIMPPLTLFLGGWGFWTLCSLAVKTEQGTGPLFLLWLGSVPFASGWAVGRHSPWPLKPRVVRCVLFWWGMILLLMGVIPAYCPIWLLLLLLAVSAALVIFGAFLGMGYAVVKR